MEEAAKLIERLGLPLVIILAVGFAVWKGLWPWAKEQWAEERRERQRERDAFLEKLDRFADVETVRARAKSAEEEFLAALKRRDETQAESNGLLTDALRELQERKARRS